MSRTKREKTLDLNLGDIIKVEWKDQSYYVGPAEASGATQECVGISLGFFMEQSKDWLTIGVERFVTDRVAYRHVLTFPKVCIISVKIIGFL